MIAIATNEFQEIPEFLLLPSANEVAEENVFTPVCQSFCSRGGGVHPLGRQPPAWADTPPGRDSPGRHPLGRLSPPRQTHPPPETATAAEGTHPTGMHSCLQLHPYLTLLQTEYEHECSQH